MAARRVSSAYDASWRTPLMKNVGVPFTPLRTPLRKSSRTRLAYTCSVISRTNVSLSRGTLIITIFHQCHRGGFWSLLMIALAHFFVKAHNVFFLSRLCRLERVYI